jgi:hypothetical protein
VLPSQLLRCKEYGADYRLGTSCLTSAAGSEGHIIDCSIHLIQGILCVLFDIKYMASVLQHAGTVLPFSCITNWRHAGT